MRSDHAQSRTLLALAAVVLVCGGLLWWPAWRQQSHLSRQIHFTQEQLLGAQGQTQDLGQLAREVQQMRRELASNHKTLPQHDELAALLREVSTKINVHQLLDASIASHATVNGADYKTLPLEVKFTGASTGALGFVKSLEDMPRVSQMTTLRLERQEKTGMLNGSLRLNAFFYTPQGAAR